MASSLPPPRCTHLCPCAQDNDGEANLYSDVMTHVTREVAVGGEEIAANAELLHQHGVTHVVNLSSLAVPNYHPDSFAYLPLALMDTPSGARGFRVVGFCQW